MAKLSDIFGEAIFGDSFNPFSPTGVNVPFPTINLTDPSKNVPASPRPMPGTKGNPIVIPFGPTPQEIAAARREKASGVAPTATPTGAGGGLGGGSGAFGGSFGGLGAAGPTNFTPSVDPAEVERLTKARIQAGLAPLRSQKRRVRKRFASAGQQAQRIDKAIQQQLKSIRRESGEIGADIQNLVAERATGTQENLNKNLDFLAGVFGSGAGGQATGSQNAIATGFTGEDTAAATAQGLGTQAQQEEIDRIRAAQVLQSGEAQKLRGEDRADILEAIAGQASALQASRPLIRDEVFDTLLKRAALQSEFGLQGAQLAEQQRQFDASFGLQKEELKASLSGSDSDKEALTLEYGKILSGIMNPETKTVTVRVPRTDASGSIVLDGSGKPIMEDQIVPVGGSGPSNIEDAVAIAVSAGVPNAVATSLLQPIFARQGVKNNKIINKTIKDTIKRVFKG